MNDVTKSTFCLLAALVDLWRGRLCLQREWLGFPDIFPSTPSRFQSRLMYRTPCCPPSNREPGKHQRVRVKPQYKMVTTKILLHIRDSSLSWVLAYEYMQSLFKVFVFVVCTFRVPLNTILTMENYSKKPKIGLKCCFQVSMERNTSEQCVMGSSVNDFPNLGGGGNSTKEQSRPKKIWGPGLIFKRRPISTFMNIF